MQPTLPEPTPLDVDLLIIGAGISGIGAACHARRSAPDLTWAIVEAREGIGGTWDLFRFPGIRSDSDMFTLSFPFRPWREPGVFASGAQIRRYLEQTVVEYDIEARLHLGQRVTALDFSSSTGRWTVTAETAAGRVQHTARFVQLASGYYSYERGHEVALPGVDAFHGQVVHPQFWPRDLEVGGKRFVVIGSGATAVTLLPALVAAGAAHVTMLQRSPSYIAPQSSRSTVAELARRWLPEGVAHHVVRGRMVAFSSLSYALLRRFPQGAQGVLVGLATRQLPPGYPVDRDFTPRYAPWDQRICVAPDGDFFRAVRAGSADVVTDTLATLTPQGLRLTSGQELPADVVVTATGLEVQFAGGAQLRVDGAAVDIATRHTYKMAMLSGVPNLAVAFGYVNASWTLRTDLTTRWFVGLLSWMRRRGLQVVTARYTEDPPSTRPIFELTSGYVQRATDRMPRQGRRWPWRAGTSYLADLARMRLPRYRREALEFR